MTEVNGVALLVLGIGLLVQALLAQACIMMKSNQIMTWSSNVLTVTLACIHSSEGLRHTDGRCMIPVAERSNPQDGPRLPPVRQSLLRETDPSVRHVTRFVWVLAPLAAVWALALAAGLSQGFRQPLYTDGNTQYVDQNNIPSHAYGLLIIGVCQTFVTLGLHSVEILVNRSRDEMLWRQVMPSQGNSRRLLSKRSGGGAPKSYTSVIAAATNWQSCILFVFYYLDPTKSERFTVESVKHRQKSSCLFRSHHSLHTNPITYSIFGE